MPDFTQTHTVIDRFRYSDAELIATDDLNGMQELSRRQLFTEFLGDQSDADWVGGIVPAVRPLGLGLRVLTTGVDMQLSVSQGGFLYAGDADPGSAQYALYHRLSAPLVLGSATDGDVTHPRHDLITVRVDDNVTDAADIVTRLIKDQSTGVISTQSITKRTRTRATFAYREGVAASTPIDPAVLTGEVAIARIVVPAGATTLTPTAIEALVTPLQPVRYERRISPFMGNIEVMSGSFQRSGFGPSRYSTVTAPAELVHSLQLPVGAELLAFHVRARPAGDSLTVRLYELDPGGASDNDEVVVLGNFSSSAAGWVFVGGALSSNLVRSDRYYQIRIFTTATGQRVSYATLLMRVR